MNNDNVNHPAHYTQGDIECIDAMLSAFGGDAVQEYCICNAFKYLWRPQAQGQERRGREQGAMVSRQVAGDRGERSEAMRTRTRIGILGYILIAICTLTGCKGTREVVREVPIYLHDTTERVREVHDTTEREVVKVIETKGDTVYITQREKERTSSNRTDTVEKIVEKAVEVEVPTPYPVMVEVERELTAWQRFKMKGFWWLSVGMVGYVLWKTRRLWGRLLKRG